MDQPIYHVYLAGPITGCEFEECTDWREVLRQALQPYGIKTLSPMRGETGTTSQDATHQRAIITRDFYDCIRSDVVVFNLLGARIVSIGTVIELAWCFQARVPTIVIMEPEGNLHEHPMVRECIGFRVSTFHEAVETLKLVLAV